MNMIQDAKEVSKDEENAMLALQLSTISTLSYALRSAINLNLLEIVSKSGPGAHVSAVEIASELPTKNANAPMIIDRMLRYLASYSIFTCKVVKGEDASEQRLYGLGPVGKYLVVDEDGVSFVPLMMVVGDKVVTDSWRHFQDVVLEGGSSLIEKAYGVPIFEYMASDSRYQGLFDKAMADHTALVMRKFLEVYKGFEGINVLVDVGGGLGANLGLIVSKYPQIKGINFDQPHVVKRAPKIPGVDHVGGNIFTKIPQGQAIFMKWILHDWADEDCLKILKNCHAVLPETGKVIVIESIVPETPGTDLLSRNVLCFDIGMLFATVGGKERTWKEFERLAKEAGFASSKITYKAYSYCAIEFYKN